MGVCVWGGETPCLLAAPGRLNCSGTEILREASQACGVSCAFSFAYFRSGCFCRKGLVCIRFVVVVFFSVCLQIVEG